MLAIALEGDITLIFGLAIAPVSARTSVPPLMFVLPV